MTEAGTFSRQAGSAPQVARSVEVRRLGLVPYADGLRRMEQAVTDRREGRIPDQLWLLEHPSVITLGSGADTAHVLLDEPALAERGVSLSETGRGGDVTLHTPGQLVGYAILDLKPDRKDLHRYLRTLEEALMQALTTLGVERPHRREGLTGVWCAAGKLAAIGVRVSSGWITSHGFALNVDPDLSLFDTIVPCGLAEERVTSLAQVLDATSAPTMERVMDVVEAAFRDVLAAGSRPFPRTPAQDGGANSNTSR